MSRASWWAALALGWAACADPEDPEPTPDAGFALDRGVRDTGPADSGDPVDAGATDLGVEDQGVAPVDSGVVDLRIDGLSAPVEVRIDERGMTHLRCRTDNDCFAVQGYYHASHRFGQMDVRRRFPQGRLAELFPIDLLVEQDALSRTFIATASGGDLAQQLWDGADQRTKDAVEAYTRGVNAFLADYRARRNGAQLTDEWLTQRNNLADWTPLDSVYVVLALANGLTDLSDYEIRLGAAYATLPRDLAMDAFGLRTGSRATTIPQRVSTSRAHGVDPLYDAFPAVQERLLQYQPLLADIAHRRPGALALPDRGSNNWVVQPSQTNNNKALMSNDPHLGMDNPSVWYLIGLDSKSQGGSIHVAGASLAGFPGILLGQNEDIAWGGTVAFLDLTDIYLETLNAAGTAVQFGKTEVPIIERPFEIRLAGGGRRQFTGRYVPHHGPIVAYDASAGTAVSVRWVGHEADTDLNVFFGMWTATSVSEAREALLNATTTGQNWVIADRAGNIGWFPYNRVPQRPWASEYDPPWLPLRGDGNAEWAGFYPYEALPQLENPPEGYIATANNDMTGALWDGDPLNDGIPYWQSLVDPGYREERVKQRLEDRAEQLNLAEMQSIQADIRSNLAEHVLPPLLEIAAGASLAGEGAMISEALRNWDYQCPTGLAGTAVDSPADRDPARTASSAGCAAFHAIWYRLIRGTFGDELAEAGIMGENARDEAMIALLVRPDALNQGAVYWDDVSTPGTETATNTVAMVFQSAGEYLAMRLGTAITDWRWGRIHTLTLRAVLLPDLGQNQFNNGPFANDGGLYTVDVANPSGGFRDSYGHGSGPSMRLSCEAEAARPVHCTIELPGGNPHLMGSPYRDAYLPDYLANRTVNVPFLPAEVDAAAQETILVRAP